MKGIYVVILMLAFFDLNAQIAPEKYWIQFTDKNGTPYSIDKPEEFLSERAIQRRVDYNIMIDEYDLPINPSYLEAIENTGAIILNPSKWLNGVSVELTNSSIMKDIKSLPFVKNTRELEDDLFKQMLKESSQNIDKTENFTAAPMRDEHYGYAYNQIDQLNGIELHNMGYRGEGMIIGVCDGGFNDADNHKVFEAVRNDGRLIMTRDFVYKNGSVFTDSEHGTSCWSLMAGNVPGEYVGTAPMASYVLCRTEDVNRENIIEEYNWVSAAEFLDSLGVDVISTSLGYIFFDDSKMDHGYEDLDGETAIITIGAEIAASKGILCVNAAGNDGANDFPYISAPADGKNVLTVGAVGVDGNKAYFSSIGPTSDGRIKPDVMANGYGTTVAAVWDSYYDGSGTSFACPVMAGMVTCLWQANKDKSAVEIIESLKNNASNTTAPNNEYGYGIPDMMQSLEYLSVKETAINNNNNIMSVFPNPSDGMVDINITEDVEVSIYNQIGVLIYSDNVDRGEENHLEYVFYNLNAGLYLVNINGKSGFQTIKFVKY